MKRIFIFTILTVFLFSCLFSSASAKELSENPTQHTAVVSVEYFDDGSYTLTSITENDSVKASGAKATTYTRSGHKDICHYNSSDELQWTYTLSGTFTVNEGVSAVCTSSTSSHSITASGWSLTANNNYYSGNTAYGDATFKKKVLFITTNTVDINAHIACDAYGNLS